MHMIRRSPILTQWARSRATSLPLRRRLATPVVSPPSPSDPFANGTNAYYSEEMYRRWRQDPKSVHASWDAYFSGLDKGLPSAQAFQPPPRRHHLPSPTDGAPALHASGGAELDDHLKVGVRASIAVQSLHTIQVQLLVRAYQVRGHHIAELDPLGILDADLADVRPPELELSRYGFAERDLDKEITLGPGILPHFATEERTAMPLRDIIKLCKRIYCELQS
jgi:2-oxoglutarate dehydrogenase E1 component